MAAEKRAPLKVGVLGAGSFVRDAYLGPLQANSGRLLVTGLWSRTAESVWKLLPDIQVFSPSCKAHYGDSGLQALLESADVEAVLVVLPPQAQGAVVQAALRAGKHVLSEKPAGPTLAQAEQLLAFHKSLPQPAPLWCVAENYRSMDAFLRLRDAIASGQLGVIARLDMAVDLAMSPGNKYFASSWRRDTTSMPGAYLTEGGVHFVAGLRMAARAAGFGEAMTAAGASRSISPDLPHPDTLAGTLWFESGASTGFSMTMAAGRMLISLRAAGTAGFAEVARCGFGATPGQGHAFRLVQQLAGDTAPTQMDGGSSGVEEELLCFARLAAAAAPGGVALKLTAREAGTAAATDGSNPKMDAAAAPAGMNLAASGAGTTGVEVLDDPSGKARLLELPSEEDAYRISCVEAVRDLAVVAALLESAAAGGQRVPIAQAE